MARSSPSSSFATSMPFTRTVPRSGWRRPTTCLSRTDFPVPLRPITTRHSPLETDRSTPRSTTFVPRRFQTPWNSIALSGKEHPEEEGRQQVIDDQDEEAGGHHRPGGRIPDRLSAAFGAEPVVAPHRRDDASEEDRLEESREDVLQLEVELEPAREGVAAHVQREHGDEVSAEDREDVGEDREHREHHDRRDEAGYDEIANGADAERLHGVDLLGHAHG